MAPFSTITLAEGIGGPPAPSTIRTLRMTRSMAPPSGDGQGSGNGLTIRARPYPVKLGPPKRGDAAKLTRQCRLCRLGRQLQGDERPDDDAAAFGGSGIDLQGVLRRPRRFVDGQL